MFKSLGERRVVLAGAVALGSIQGGPAFAQDVDPNLLSRIESFIPTPTTPPAIPTTTVQVVEERTIPAITETVRVPIETLQAQAAAKGIVLPLTAKTEEEQRSFFRSIGLETEMTKTIRRAEVVKVFKEKTVSKRVEVSLTGVTGYTYASNATQTSTNIVADSIAANNVALGVKVRVGTTDDVLAFSVTPGATRYANLDSKSFDAIAGGAAFAHFYPKRYLSAYQTPGTTTRDTLTVGTALLASYDPGFSSERIQAVTPSIAWERANMPIGRQICGTPKDEKYCYALKVGVIVAKSWTSISSQDQATVNFPVTLTWNTRVKGLALTGGGSLQGSLFTNFSGGRQDLIVIPILKAVWTPNDKITLTAGASYTDQTSTESIAQWAGFRMNPQAQLKITF